MVIQIVYSLLVLRRLDCLLLCKNGEVILEEFISKSPKASKECHMSFDNRMIAENFNKSALNQTNITCN
jgi:hypothetical protein